MKSARLLALWIIAAPDLAIWSSAKLAAQKKTALGLKALEAAIYI